MINFIFFILVYLKPIFCMTAYQVERRQFSDIGQLLDRTSESGLRHSDQVELRPASQRILGTTKLTHQAVCIRF